MHRPKAVWKKARMGLHIRGVGVELEAKAMPDFRAKIAKRNGFYR
jgi:hypothetical protein